MYKVYVLGLCGTLDGIETTNVTLSDGTVALASESHLAFLTSWEASGAKSIRTVSMKTRKV